MLQITCTLTASTHRPNTSTRLQRYVVSHKSYDFSHSPTKINLLTQPYQNQRQHHTSTKSRKNVDRIVHQARPSRNTCQNSLFKKNRDSVVTQPPCSPSPPHQHPVRARQYILHLPPYACPPVAFHVEAQRSLPFVSPRRKPCYRRGRTRPVAGGIRARW